MVISIGSKRCDHCTQYTSPRADHALPSTVSRGFFFQCSWAFSLAFGYARRSTGGRRRTSWLRQMSRREKVLLFISIGQTLIEAAALLVALLK
jgi:hypothetical protein